MRGSSVCLRRSYKFGIHSMTISETLISLHKLGNATLRPFSSLAILAHSAHLRCLTKTRYICSLLSYQYRSLTFISFGSSHGSKKIKKSVQNTKFERLLQNLIDYSLYQGELRKISRQSVHNNFSV